MNLPVLCRHVGERDVRLASLGTLRRSPYSFAGTHRKVRQVCLTFVPICTVPLEPVISSRNLSFRDGSGSTHDDPPPR